jgi:hypothetical protein
MRPGGGLLAFRQSAALASLISDTNIRLSPQSREIHTTANGIVLAH